MSYLNPSPIVIGDRTDFPKMPAADSERLTFCRVNLSGTLSVKML